MQRKAYVCFSGGLDSTTALYMAHADFEGNVEAVSFDYGQRHVKETEYAARTCNKLGIRHSIISLGGLLSGDGVMLTDASVTVPDIAYSDIKGVSPTFVPFRNGTMLSVITAIAQKYVMQEIDAHVRAMKDQSTLPEEERVPEGELLSDMELKELATNQAKDLVTIYAGQHAEDAKQWAYPDCTFEFLGSMANAIYVGTYSTIRLSTPFVFSSKHQIVAIGSDIGVPYEDSWSCYKGEVFHCGVCPTCRSRKEAFIMASVPDPTEYAR